MPTYHPQFKGFSRNVTIANGSTTTITTIYPAQGSENLWVEVSNLNHKALDLFQIEYSPTSDSSYYPVANASSDYTTSMRWPLLGSTVDVCTLAKNTAGMLSLFCKGVYSVRFKASSAAASNTVLALKWETR